MFDRFCLYDERSHAQKFLLFAVWAVVVLRVLAGNQLGIGWLPSNEFWVMVGAVLVLSSLNTQDDIIPGGGGMGRGPSFLRFGGVLVVATAMAMRIFGFGSGELFTLALALISTYAISAVVLWATYHIKSNA